MVPPAADLIIKGKNRTIKTKTVTFNFHRMKEGAVKLKISEFAVAIFKHVG